MANPYHDFSANKVSKHGYESLNDTIGGLGDAVAEHFKQQEANKDAIKYLIMKSQLEKEQEQNKQQGEFDMEGKRIERGRRMFPGMFPQPSQDILPAQADAPVTPPANLPAPAMNPNPPAMTLLGGGQGDAQGNSVDFNPLKSSTPAPVMQNRIKNPVGSGWDVNPNFAISGKGDMFAKRPDNSLQLQEKQDQFNQREWDKLTKEVNPLTTSGRNPLGMAMKANYNANRALSTLSNPMVTNQEAGNVMGDIASIYQNGSPTQYGMAEQGYRTLKAKVEGFKQFLTGEPTDALTPEIKNRLQNVLYDMKRTNFDVLRQNLDYTEKAKSKLIKAFPDEWKQMRETLESDAYSGLNDKGSNKKSEKLSGSKDYSALWSQ